MMNEDRIIYRQDLYKMLGVTSETLRRWVKENKLPPAGACQKFCVKEVIR